MKSIRFLAGGAGVPAPFFGVMSEINEVLGGKRSPIQFFRSVFFKFLFWKNNPTYFYPAGIWVFCGAQGSGKTLSAVQTLLKLKQRYPLAKVVSNLHIQGVDYIPFTDYQQLVEMSNGTEGIIFFLDEIHVLWNSLESKDIPISEMATFCQMRKDRRVIIGTSQVYNRIAKPIREQLQYVIKCRNFFNLLQYNVCIDPAEGVEKDGHLTGKIVSRRIWWHTPELYTSYDTLTKISRANREKPVRRLKP